MKYYKFESGRDGRAKKRVLWTIEKKYTSESDFDLYIHMYLSNNSVFLRHIPDYTDRICDIALMPVFSEQPHQTSLKKLFEVNEKFYDSAVINRCVRTFFDILERSKVINIDDVTYPDDPMYYLHLDIRRQTNFVDMKQIAIQKVLNYFESGKISLDEVQQSPEYIAAEEHFQNSTQKQNN